MNKFWYAYYNWIFMIFFSKKNELSNPYVRFTHAHTPSSCPNLNFMGRQHLYVITF